MQEWLAGLGLSVWIVGPLIFVCWVVALYAVKAILYRRLISLSNRTKSPLDDIVLSALNIPLALIILGTGLLILERTLPLSPAWDRSFIFGFRLTLLVAGGVFTDRLLRGFIQHYAAKMPALEASQSLVKGLTRVVVLALGVFIILDNLGISITPLIASLGVGSLAVALALQSTLTNLFAGIQLVADRTIEVGQFIGLESGEEGWVEKVGWRSTRIRSLSNNLVVVPNSSLVSSRFTNYSLPADEMSVVMQVGVHYASDLGHVERVTTEVARDIQQTVEGAVRDFQPFIRYHTFGEHSINFSVILRARDFVGKYLMTHEFVKRLHVKYREEGIIIPFPIRTLNMSPELLERLPGARPGSSSAPAGSDE